MDHWSDDYTLRPLLATLFGHDCLPPLRKVFLNVISRAEDEAALEDGEKAAIIFKATLLKALQNELRNADLLVKGLEGKILPTAQVAETEIARFVERCLRDANQMQQQSLPPHRDRPEKIEKVGKPSLPPQAPKKQTDWFIEIFFRSKEAKIQLTKNWEHIVVGAPKFFEREKMRWVERRHQLDRLLEQIEPNDKQNRARIEEKKAHACLFDDIELDEPTSRERPRRFFKKAFRYCLIPRRQIGIRVVNSDGIELNMKVEFDSLDFNMEDMVVPCQNVKLCDDINKTEKMLYEWNHPVIDSTDPKASDSIDRFIRMIRYFSDKGKMAFVSKERLEKGLTTILNLVGGDLLSADLRKQFEYMTLSSCAIDRGYLFWGPPGTGKSTIINQLCKSMGLITITEFLTAADFQQGYVGDSEKMLAELSERSDSVPWEMVIVAVDEVDGLVVDRKGSGNGNLNLMSQILGMFGGLKDEGKNLTLMATTNRIEKIDSAFLRRIKSIFVGLPSFSQRRQWISGIDPNSPLRPLFQIEDDKVLELGALKHDLVKMTLNFSHDGMQKLMKKLLHRYGSPPHTVTLSDLKEVVKEVASSDNTHFGQYFLPTLLEGTKLDSIAHDDLAPLGRIASSSLPENLCPKSFWSLHQLTTRPHSAVRPLMLIDLKAPEQLQVLFQSMVRLNADENEVFARASKLVAKPLQELELQKQETLLCDTARIILKKFSDLINKDTIRSLSVTLKNLEDVQQGILHNKLRDCLESGGPPAFNSFLELLEMDPKEWEDVTSPKCKHLCKIRTLDATSFFCECQGLVFDRDGVLPFMTTALRIRFVQMKNSLLPQLFNCIQFCVNAIKDEINPHRGILTWRLPKLEENTQNALETTLATLLLFAMTNEIHYVQLVDSLLLLQKNNVEDQNATRMLDEILKESEEYPTSMLIFDLDSLVGLNININGLNSQILSSTPTKEAGGGMSSLSYSERRPMTLATTFDIARTAVTGGRTTRWIVCISSDPYITRQFKSKLDWLTEEDHQNMKREEERRKYKQCAYCHMKFNEMENNVTQCGRHTEQLLWIMPEDNVDEQGKKVLLNQLKKKTFEEARNMVRNGEIQASQCKWVCCGGDLWSRGEIGATL